jgi:hypothetical protein
MNDEERNAKTEPLSSGEKIDSVILTGLRKHISEYKVTINGVYRGTIMEDCLGHAARSAMLTLKLENISSLTIESVRWGSMGAKCTYHKPYINETLGFFYETKE